MRYVIALVLLCVAPAVFESAEVAPRKAAFGREVLVSGERLLASFSIHAKILILKGNLDKPLMSKMQPLPIYPNESLHAGQVGEATVSFTINEDGRVDSVQLEKASVNEFAQPSVAAVSQWSFSPPEYRGKSTALAVQVTFLFSIFDEQG